MKMNVFIHISSAVLTKMIIAELNHIYWRTVTDAVITVPAYFNDSQRSSN